MPSQNLLSNQLAVILGYGRLPAVVIDKLVLLCKVKSVKKGEQLLVKNAPAEGLFCLLSEQIKVSM